MKHSNIINKVSKELNLDVNIIDKTYKAFWLFIKQYIQELPLKQDITKEDFDKIKTNINIPSLGKLHATYEEILKIKKSFKNAKD